MNRFQRFIESRGHRQWAIGNRPEARGNRPKATGQRQQALGQRQHAGGVLGSDSIDQANEPSPKSVDLDGSRRATLENPQLNGEVNLAVELAGRANGYPQKPGKLVAGTTTCSFSDVGADRDRRRSHLGCETVSLLAREVPSELVDRLTEGNALPPDFEPPKVTHPCLVNRRKIGTEPPRPRQPLWPIAYGLGLMASSLPAWKAP